MAKTIRSIPTPDKPKRKYKRDRDYIRTILRSTMDTDTSMEVSHFQVLASQLSAEERDLSSYYYQEFL